MKRLHLCGVRSAPLLPLLLFAATPADAQPVSADEAMAHARSLTGNQRCSRGTDGEIVVCAGNGDKYRLPFPEERTPNEDRNARRGDIQAASAAPISYADCGIFQHQRRCSKAEMRRYGYGGGKDPLSWAIKLGTKIVDPDADVGTPKAVPKSLATEPR